MIELNVCRGSSVVGSCLESDDALNWGPDISDPLLTTIPSGQERGRVEIDSVYTNRKAVKLSLPYQTWRQPGILVGVTDGSSVLNGLLDNISITHVVGKDSIQVGSELGLEMPA